MNETELARVISAAIDAALSEHSREMREVTAELRLFRLRSHGLLHVQDN